MRPLIALTWQNFTRLKVCLCIDAVTIQAWCFSIQQLWPACFDVPIFVGTWSCCILAWREIRAGKEWPLVFLACRRDLRQRFASSTPHGHSRGLLQKIGLGEDSIQASIQSLHRTKHGDIWVCFSTLLSLHVASCVGVSIWGVKLNISRCCTKSQPVDSKFCKPFRDYTA